MTHSEFQLPSGETGVVRDYDTRGDPARMTQHLFTSMSEEEVKDTNAFFEEDPENRFRLVAEIGGELHGTVTVVRETLGMGSHRAGVYGVVVSEEFRGSGLAAELVEACVAACRERGIRILTLSTWQSDTRARRFYEKCGFRKYGELPGGLPRDGHYETEVLYYREI